MRFVCFQSFFILIIVQFIKTKRFVRPDRLTGKHAAESAPDFIVPGSESPGLQHPLRALSHLHSPGASVRLIHITLRAGDTSSMFDRMFRNNNPFWQSMGTVYDVFIVNSLWLLCCIPVFTIGSATTAAYYALIQRLLG